MIKIYKTKNIDKTATVVNPITAVAFIVVAGIVCYNLPAQVATLLLIYVIEPYLYTKTAVKIYKQLILIIIALIAYELVKRYLI